MHTKGGKKKLNVHTSALEKFKFMANQGVDELSLKFACDCRQSGLSLLPPPPLPRHAPGKVPSLWKNLKTKKGKKNIENENVEERKKAKNEM